MKISKVAVVMGSISDLEVTKPCIQTLDALGVGVEVQVLSAHRTPHEVQDFALNAKKNGIEVIIAVAGKAAHLGGVFASLISLPIIALPVATKMMGGLDSLLSMVQMPKGVPVATVGIDAGENAGVLAAQILALKYPELAEKLDNFKKEIAQKVSVDNAKMKEKLPDILGV